MQERLGGMGERYQVLNLPTPFTELLIEDVPKRVGENLQKIFFVYFLKRVYVKIVKVIYKKLCCSTISRSQFLNFLLNVHQPV